MQEEPIKRQTNGRYELCTASEAMEKRALGNQSRADEPPDSPKHYNRHNPDSGVVGYTNAGGEVVAIQKPDNRNAKHIYILYHSILKSQETKVSRRVVWQNHERQRVIHVPADMGGVVV